MPRRTADRFGEYHGKHKYISKAFQSDWKEKGDNIEVKTHVEIEQGERVEIPTDVPISGEVADHTVDDTKKARRKKILKAHPDKGGSEEELKKILDE